jgi:hypothetical protein
MTLELIEKAVGEMRDYLEANLDAKVVVVSARYTGGDAITLDPIAHWYEGNMPSKAIPKYPAVVVHGQGLHADEMHAGDPKLFNSYYVNVVVLVTDEDDEKRFKKLSRYAVAVIELLPDGESEYGYIHWLEEMIRWTDSVGPAPSFMQAVVIPIRLYNPNGELY